MDRQRAWEDWADEFALDLGVAAELAADDRLRPIGRCLGRQRQRATSWSIAVIPKATSHEFWKSVHAGAVEGAEEAGVDIVWKGPITESDREQQINLVQDFIAQEVDGICLAPLDSQALMPVVHEAAASKIPAADFRQRPGRHPRHRQLRGHRQLPRRPDRRPAPGPAARRPAAG